MIGILGIDNKTLAYIKIIQDQGHFVDWIYLPPSMKNKMDLFDKPISYLGQEFVCTRHPEVQIIDTFESVGKTKHKLIYLSGSIPLSMPLLKSLNAEQYLVEYVPSFKKKKELKNVYIASDYQYINLPLDGGDIVDFYYSPDQIAKPMDIAASQILPLLPSYNYSEILQNDRSAFVMTAKGKYHIDLVCQPTPKKLVSLLNIQGLYVNGEEVTWTLDIAEKTLVNGGISAIKHFNFLNYH